ncbi:MAG: hypothetical protein OEV00_00015 [Acidobacteriota bacterium]|nr:hypothetical protein [Acidobacteriota bacterium]MDH3783688.1 hypothetical protein [Acidobacteriota bacterium]
MGRVIIACFFGLVLLAGGLVVRHYHDSYTPTLRPRAEGWPHMPARHYEEELGEAATMVRDYVYFGARPGVSASVLTETDPLFSKLTATQFRDVYKQTMTEAFPGSKFGDCHDVETEDIFWTCMELNDHSVDPGRRQRAYFTRRGNSNVLVLFTSTPPQNFRSFGSTKRWLEDLEWNGPGLTHAF